MEAGSRSDSVEMKQEDESDNTGGTQDGVMSETEPKECKSSGDTQDEPKAESASGNGKSVSGPTNTSDGEDHAAGPAVYNTAEPTGADSTTCCTSPEPNSAANTSGSSLGGVTGSPCSEMEVDGRAESEMDRSISSCNDSVSESNPRESFSPCSEGSSLSGGIDKGGKNCNLDDIDHSHPPPVDVPTCDGRQAEDTDESMAESHPRDSLSSSSQSSTPSTANDRSGRNSGISDIDQSPSNPPPGTTSSSDGCSEDAVCVSEVDCQSDARSGTTSKGKMTLRSGRVTQVESVPSKKHRDLSKKKNVKSLERPTKRRFSVDEQSQSSAEETPGKVFLLDSSDILMCLDETGNIAISQTEEISSVSSALLKANTTSTNAEDLPPGNELPLLANADDFLVHETSQSTPAEYEEATMETSVDEKLTTDNSEVEPNNELNTVVKEQMPVQAPIEKSTNSESSANLQPANNAMETGSLPSTDIGGVKHVDFSLLLQDTPPSNVLFASDSDVCVEDRNENQPSDPPSQTSRYSALNSDMGFSVCDCNETNTDALVELACKECSEEAKKEFAICNCNELCADVIIEHTCKRCYEEAKKEFAVCDCNGTTTNTLVEPTCQECIEEAKKEIAVCNANETSTNTPVEDTCNDIDCSEGAENMESQEAPTVEISSGSRQVSPDAQKSSCLSALWDIGTSAHSFFSSTGRRNAGKLFERNVSLDAEVVGKGEQMETSSQAVHCYGQDNPTTDPDSSTERIMEQVTSNTATKVQHQMSTTSACSSEVTTGELMSCASLHDDCLLQHTKKIIKDENRNTASCDMQDAEDQTEAKVPQGTGVLGNPEESGTSFALPLQGNFGQRDLQIYRYITTNSGSTDVRYSPYVTRRRPLRSGNSTQWDVNAFRASFDGRDNYHQALIRRRLHEAAQMLENDSQRTTGTLASLGDTCSIS